VAEESAAVLIARLEERVAAFAGAMAQLTHDMRRLTDSYEKLVDSDKTVAMLEAEVMSLKESNRDLWNAVKELRESSASQARGMSRVLWDALKLVGAAVLGALAMRWVR
jgi:FtsZ-binding cell division protein ZapB